MYTIYTIIQRYDNTNYKITKILISNEEQSYLFAFHI